MARMGPTIAAAILLSTGLQAQRSSLGLKAGALLSTTSSEVVHYQPIVGGTFGIYAPINIGRGVELQPELLVSFMGAAYKAPERDAVVDRTMYIHVPVSVKYFTGQGFNIQAGMQFGNFVRATRMEAGSSSDVSDRYENMDLGFNGGIGFGFQSGLDLAVRYYGGAKAILVDDDALFPRNRSLQFTIGHRLVGLSGSSIRRRK